MSSKTARLIDLIEELNADAASISGDIDTLRDEIREKARELEAIQNIAKDKLSELEEALEEDFDSDDNEEDDEFDLSDDDDFRTMEGLLEEIDGWVDEANDLV